MDIHEQVDEILSHVDPEERQASEYDKERAKWFVEQTIARQGPGEWKLGDIKSIVMEHTVSCVYSLQFWFVMLIDEKTHRVAGEIFSEARD